MSVRFEGAAPMPTIKLPSIWRCEIRYYFCGCCCLVLSLYSRQPCGRALWPQHHGDRRHIPRTYRDWVHASKRTSTAKARLTCLLHELCCTVQRSKVCGRDCHFHSPASSSLPSLSFSCTSELWYLRRRDGGLLLTVGVLRVQSSELNHKPLALLDSVVNRWKYCNICGATAVRQRQHGNINMVTSTVSTRQYFAVAHGKSTLKP